MWTINPFSCPHLFQSYFSRSWITSVYSVLSNKMGCEALLCSKCLQKWDESCLGSSKHCLWLLARLPCSYLFVFALFLRQETLPDRSRNGYKRICTCLTDALPHPPCGPVSKQGRAGRHDQRDGLRTDVCTVWFCLVYQGAVSVLVEETVPLNTTLWEAS